MRKAEIAAIETMLAREVTTRAGMAALVAVLRRHDQLVLWQGALNVALTIAVIVGRFWS